MDIEELITIGAMLWCWIKAKKKKKKINNEL
jgi:hypothetical protein